PRAQPGRERLAVLARQLALQPHLQILRRSRRPLLCGMEQARRSALAHHVHRTAPMGPRVLINGIWYKSARASRSPRGHLLRTQPRPYGSRNREGTTLAVRRGTEACSCRPPCPSRRRNSHEPKLGNGSPGRQRLAGWVWLKLDGGGRKRDLTWR